MERRGFLKLSGTTAAAIVVAPSLITEPLKAADGTLYESYDKIMLKDAEGNPLKASTLVQEENYVFNFPHVSTPCFLVKLTGPAQKNVQLVAEDGTEYTFKGGSGKEGDIVAYTAICPHQFAYPNPDVTFFQYVPKGTNTVAYSTEKDGVFVCSSHLSAFSAKEGGKRLVGPTKEPLAQIVLEIDENDVIWAVGVLGPHKFHDFLKAFKSDFKKFYGNKRKAKKLVKTEAKVLTLKNYTADIQQF